MSKAKRTILQGAAAVLALWPARSGRYERIVHRNASDADAIAQDWAAVGRDLRQAMNRVERERERN